jgi:hypothetical protein
VAYTYSSSSFGRQGRRISSLSPGHISKEGDRREKEEGEEEELSA